MKPTPHRHRASHCSEWSSTVCRAYRQLLDLTSLHSRFRRTLQQAESRTIQLSRKSWPDLVQELCTKRRASATKRWLRLGARSRNGYGGCEPCVVPRRGLEPPRLAALVP